MQDKAYRTVIAASSAAVISVLAGFPVMFINIDTKRRESNKRGGGDIV